MSYCDQGEHSQNSLSTTEFCNEVYLTVLGGNLLKLRSLITRRQCKKEDARNIFELNHVALQSSHGIEHAPAIVIASKYGHHKIVNYLIKEYNVDINSPGNVKFDGFLIEGATALWCAAGAGHMEIVRCLVENGADVNKTTNSNSTPLRAACFDGRIDIVRYLVQHNADITIANRYKNNCLMISAFRGHLSVVQFLLSCGMDPNKRAMANATALQFAAETGRTEICRALIEAGAVLLCNDSGLDQLFVAAENAQADVVMYMVLEPRLCIDRRHHVEALELLGAMLLNDKDKYDPIVAFRLLRQALAMRNDAEQPVPKNLLPTAAAYRHRQECQTVEELDDLQYDFELLELEGLMIRERVLGRQFIELTGPIVYRGAVYADMLQFDRCLELWMHALRIRAEQQQPAGKDLLRLTQVMSQMISLRTDVEFRIAYEVMSLCCQELHRSRLRCRQQPVKLSANTTAAAAAGSNNNSNSSNNALEAYMQDMRTVLYLLALLCKVKMSVSEEQLTYKLVHSLVRADFRLKTGCSLLHMACDPATEIDTFHVNSVVRVPNATVVKLLLICGANPNARSNSGDTPLHHVVRYDQALPDFVTLESVINQLIRSGAHPDIRNCNGQRPVDATGHNSSTSIVQLVLASCCQLKLLCLSATAVANHSLPLAGLPPGLAEFVQLHAKSKPLLIGIGPETPSSMSAVSQSSRNQLHGRDAHRKDDDDNDDDNNDDDDDEASADRK